MQSLEPVSVMFTILTVFTSSQVAEVLAPYIIIVMGAFTGASWTLGAMESKLTFQKIIFFYIKSIFTAILITAFISNMLSDAMQTDIKWLFAPVAFILGMMGYKWIGYLELILKRLANITEKK